MSGYIVLSCAIIILVCIVFAYLLTVAIIVFLQVHSQCDHVM